MNRRSTENMNRYPTRALVVLALGLLTLLLAQPAGATTDPRASVRLDCQSGRVVAHFAYAGFNPANRNLQATERLGARTKTITLTLNSAGADSDVMAIAYQGGRVSASTVVVSASGRVKARASATIRCTTPPPPAHYDPRAWMQGPCEDPMYRAVLDNRRSNRAVTFRIRYLDFAAGWTTIERTVRRDRLVRTAYFHVAGFSPMTIRARGRLLFSDLSAAPGTYRPCWA